MRRNLTLGAVILAVGLLNFGCATKKYVRNTVAPIDKRLTDVSKKADENTSKIHEVSEQSQQGISHAEESATAADSKATEAGRQASGAADKATEAGRQAGEARDVAEKGLQRADDLQRTINGLDDYRLVSEGVVLFRPGSAEITAEATAKLDEAARQAGSLKHVVIEVQGFADATGSRAINISLSERRAAAVVKYLTRKHQLPLRKIHTLAMGQDEPVASNATRNGRRLNRRVEVKVYAAGSEAEAAKVAASPAVTD